MSDIDYELELRKAIARLDRTFESDRQYIEMYVGLTLHNNSVPLAG